MPIIKVQERTAGPVAEMLLRIEAIKLSPSRPFTWSSGWKSPIYCDNRLSLSYPEIRSAIRDGLIEAIRENFSTVQCIAGVATAGIPQAALVADKMALPMVYVRPKPKDHGMQNLIEGRVVRGQSAVLVEDLVSTGGSSLKAAQALEDAGVNVIGMVSIFNYGFEIATYNFHEANISLVSLSDYNCLLQTAVAGKYIDDDQVVSLKSWRVDPANWMK